MSRQGTPLHADNSNVSMSAAGNGDISMHCSNKPLSDCVNEIYKGDGVPGTDEVNDDFNKCDASKKRSHTSKEDAEGDPVEKISRYY